MPHFWQWVQKGKGGSGSVSRGGRFAENLLTVHSSPPQISARENCLFAAALEQTTNRQYLLCAIPLKIICLKRNNPQSSTLN